jgi:hypothetical protein
VAAALASADVALFPAAGEGFGLAAAEALMVGVPVVACHDGGGVLTVVPASGAGRRAELTADSLARAANDLLTDPGARCRRSAGARWRHELSPAHAAEACERWYRSAACLRDSSVPPRWLWRPWSSLVARSTALNWDELQRQPVQWTVRPVRLVLSLLMVWLMYANLIGAWRAVLRGWGERLTPLEAARIWTVSSLGKYVPGKVWAVAGMALMAREAGVSVWAATASAVVLQAIAVGTGVLAAFAGGVGPLDAVRPGLATAFRVGAVGVTGIMALLFYPPVLRRLLLLAGLPQSTATPPAGVIWRAAAANLLAWVGYGLAFWLLARALVPQVSLSPGLAIAAFAASYVAGLLALFAPGGLIVREGLLVALLQGTTGLGVAALLAVASRIALTITEIGAAVPFLLIRVEKPSVD